MSPSRQHSKNFNRWGNQISSSYAFFAFIAFGAGAAAAAFLAPFFAMLITWMERYLKEKTCVTQDNAFLRCNISSTRESWSHKLTELHHLCQYKCNACPAEIKAKVEPESIGSWISPTSCAMIHRQTYSTATSACTVLPQNVQLHSSTR